MKKYFLLSWVVLSATLFVSCSDELGTDTEEGGDTAPGAAADVEMSLATTYNILNTLGGGNDNSGILNNPFYWWCLMSDDCYGSGGLYDNVAKSLHHFTTLNTEQYEFNYNLLYSGILRANYVIESINNMNWTDEEITKRNQLLGEAFFIRGLYQMWFSQLYGDVPLLTSTNITDEMKQEVSAEDYIYPQIISDFVSAKTLMKAERANGSGHADKYCAEAFLARAYMFWAGFYKKVGELAQGSPDITLVEQEGCSGGYLTRADVVNGLKDIVSNGGYKLRPDFRSLWQYSNSLLLKEALDGKGHEYKFIADMNEADCFDMSDNGNGNTEELFQIQFHVDPQWTIDSPYGYPCMYSNNLSYYWGLRNSATNNNGKRDKTYPFNEGLGQGTPSCNIWDDWTDAERAGGYTDLRKRATLIELDNIDEVASYTYEMDDCEESGYAVKKYAEVNLDANPADNESWWKQAPGYSANMFASIQQGDHFEDFYLMRYSDVLLMLTELTGDASFMNQVQERAGVPLTSYSLENVKNERRWEFAMEGLRFNDMRRWSGFNSGQGSYAARALQRQEGQRITCLGHKSFVMEHMTCSWSKRYADTNGFLPKPKTQIDLSGGALKQNPGWDENTSADEYAYKVIY